MLLLVQVATDADVPGGGAGWRTALTRALDVVHALLNEERNGPLGGHQVLQRHAEVVALPGPPGGRVQRFEGLGWFLRSKTENSSQDGGQEERRRTQEVGLALSSHNPLLRGALPWLRWQEPKEQLPFCRFLSFFEGQLERTFPPLSGLLTLETTNTSALEELEPLRCSSVCVRTFVHHGARSRGALSAFTRTSANSPSLVPLASWESSSSSSSCPPARGRR